MIETPSVFIVADEKGGIHFHTDGHSHPITLEEARAVVRIVKAHDALVNALLENVADCTHPCDECPERDGCLTPKALAAVYE